MTSSIVKLILMLFVAMLIWPADLYAQTSGRKSRRPAKVQPSTKQNAEFDQVVKRAGEARLGSRLDEALDLYGKALQIRPKWSDGWWYAGAIFYEKDLYAQARDAFRNLVALEPNRAPAWGMLGLCEFQTREYERAVVSLQRGRSIGLSANRELESVVRYHTALLYIRYEEFEVAFDILKEFLAVANQSPKVMEAFGLTLLRMPFLPNEVPADKRDQIRIAGRAGYAMAARHLEEARSAFAELLKRYPEAPNVHYAHGVFLMHQDADAALKGFQRELEISPSHHPAMVQMAFEYMKRGDYETALPLAEKSVELAPKMYPARNVLGRVLLHLGQVERAVRELEEGVRLAPTSPEMRFALARAYTRAGRQADARREQEVFKQLQEEYESRRVPGANNVAGESQPKETP